jgi:MSHA biogenesis protein MshO
MTSRKSHGFTLVELIITMVITTIVGGMIAVFMRAPVQSYVDTSRRGGMTDLADAVVRRVAREVRLSVPNSPRATSSGNNQLLEFLPVQDGGRYRVDPSSAGTGNILDFTDATDDRFDVFSSSLTATTGDYLVIYNTNQCAGASCSATCTATGGLNAYQGCNRRTIAAPFSGGLLQFTATGLPLPTDSPGHRFLVVPKEGPITFACIETAPGSGSFGLYRYTNYAIASGNWSTQPTSFSVASSLLANDLSQCQFNYEAADGLLTIQLAITRGEETVRLYQEVHIDNQP